MDGQPSTKEGVTNAQRFFDLCDQDPILRQAVSYTNGSIIHLAATKGLSFNYADMQEHLRARWGVTKAPTDFCCT